MASTVICVRPVAPGISDADDVDLSYLDDPTWVPCCMASAERGPTHCTCWEPVYDLEQQAPRVELEPTTRSRMCGDCAYRADSPERQADPYGLLYLSNFWCHRGVRRPVKWVHPDGRELAGDPADYQPPIVDDIPYRADGRPAARCGGWARWQRSEVPA